MNHNQFIFCLVTLGIICLFGAAIYHHCSKVDSNSEKVVMGTMNSISTGVVCVRMNEGEFFTWLSCEVRSANGKAIKVGDIVSHIGKYTNTYLVEHVWEVNPYKHLIHIQSWKWLGSNTQKEFDECIREHIEMYEGIFTERKDLNDLLGLQ